MPDLVMPTASGAISDGAKIGAAADTFVLHPLRLQYSFGSSEVYDTTGDGDTANQKCVLPWAFWEKQFVFSGLLVGSSTVGFANAGATAAGVAVTMTFETGMTLAGNLLVNRIQGTFARKSCVAPIVFIGQGVGAWAEA